MKPIPPAPVTVGGTISILNVVPGGGLLQAGTVVSIIGMGFHPKTQVQLNNIKTGPITVVNSQLIQFTVAEATSMTGKKIQVVNRDGSQDSYFSYMRGIPLAQSSRPLLGPAVPIFSDVTHTKAVFAPMGAASANRCTGLAMQNPSQSPANVTVALHAPDGALLGSSAVVLPSGYRLMGETSEMAQGAAPVPGSYVVVSSDQPIQMFGFVGDAAAGTVTPFLPVQAQP
jgi:IPT/TIG domain